MKYTEEAMLKMKMDKLTFIREYKNFDLYGYFYNGKLLYRECFHKPIIRQRLAKSTRPKYERNNVAL